MKKNKSLYKIMSLLAVNLSFIMMTGLLLACDKENEVPSLHPDFECSLHPSKANVFVFQNTTLSDHYFVRWNFGNGERTDRIPVEEGNSMQVFYAEKGEFDVEFTVWGHQNDLANNKSITKTVTVDSDIFNVSFDVKAKPGSLNHVVLTNTTIGDYETLEWIVDGESIDNNLEELEVYLPLAGEYNIELKISQGTYEQSKNIKYSINNDDPEYFNRFALVWYDEFEGTTVNSDKWSFETGQHGWGNNEWQNYTNGSNSTISNGKLCITARKTGTGQKVGDYSSSRMNSKQSFTYGRFEIRAKMPDYKGPGLWPAIWMLGESIKNGRDWPLCGEIDIMEYVSFDPNHVSCAIHTESNNHRKGNAISSGHVSLESAEEEYHIYGLLWTKQWLKFYRDDIENVILTYKRPNNYTKENWPYDEPAFVLLNVAVGGDYGGVNGVDDSVFPASMDVDYVRVYQYQE